MGQGYAPANGFMGQMAAGGAPQNPSGGMAWPQRRPPMPQQMPPQQMPPPQQMQQPPMQQPPMPLQGGSPAMGQRPIVDPRALQAQQSQALRR